MAAGKDEAVAVRPIGVGGVVAHDTRPQDMGERRQGHGRAGVARIGLAGGVHGQATDDVDAKLLDRLGRFDRCRPGGVFGHVRQPTRSPRPPDQDLGEAPGRRPEGFARAPRPGAEGLRADWGQERQGHDRRLAVGDEAAMRLHRPQLVELELTSD